MYHQLCVYARNFKILLITTLFYFILLIWNYKTWKRNVCAWSLWNTSGCAYKSKILKYLLVPGRLFFTSVTDKRYFLMLFFETLISYSLFDECSIWEDVPWIIYAGDVFCNGQNLRLVKLSMKAYLCKEVVMHLLEE